MTGTVGFFLALTLVVAVVDWYAVHKQNKPLEYAAKPGTMVMLIIAVLAMQPTSTTARSFFVAALALSMLGDIFLMLPDREKWFVFGLGAFLLGHLAYIPGLWTLGVSFGAFVLGVVLVVIGIAAIGRPIVKGVGKKEPKLTAPVAVYMTIISVMVASAIGTAIPVAIVGALLFYCSDALIAINGFIKEYPWGKLAIITTYHLAQIALALALVA